MIQCHMPLDEEGDSQGRNNGEKETDEEVLNHGREVKLGDEVKVFLGINHRYTL